MANKSGWKDSERKAAKLFPGGKRRTRVGGTYSTIADDVIWGPEKDIGAHVVKLPVETGYYNSGGKRVVEGPDISPVYIEVKKRAKIEMVTTFKATEKKYFQDPQDKLALVLHLKHDKRQFVMVDDRFFFELIRAWCGERGLFVREMVEEEKQLADEEVAYERGG